MSDVINFKIKNYEENDVKKELELYNNIMKSFDTQSYVYTVENMDYRYKNKDFNPEQVKFLLLENSKEIIGYCAVDLADNEAHIEYPFILEEYRSQELMEFLFNKSLTYARTKRDVITSDPYKEKITPINDFLKSQGGIVHEKSDNYKIEVEKLNFDLSPFTAHQFSLNDINKLEDFIKNAKKPTDSSIDREYFETRFKDGDFDPKRFTYLEKDGKVVGAISGSKEKTENSEEPTLARLNYYLIDLEHPDSVEIRKMLAGSLYNGFKEEGIEEFHVVIGENSLAKPIFEKIGFKSMNESFVRYKF